MLLMIAPIIGIGGIAVILATAELLMFLKVIRQGELTRKFVHILTATFIASWPFFMSRPLIQLLSGLMLLVVIMSKYMGVSFNPRKFPGVTLGRSTFRSVHNVDRHTYGELLFPVAIFLSASLAGSDWIFAAAMLHLGLADGLAAAIGVQNLGHMNYKIFGQAKSLIGSLTFLAVSISVTAAIVFWLSPAEFGPWAPAVVIWLPLTATLVENLAVWGTDNVLVPLVVVTALNVVQVGI